MLNRTDARAEVRCETCLCTMERRESELRFVCRNNDEHTEPFRDERGNIITAKRTRKTTGPIVPTPTATEPEPGPLTPDQITRFREQISTDKRPDFDTAVDAAAKQRAESETRIHSEQDESIADAQAKHEKAMIGARVAHDRKVKTALAVALGVAEAPKSRKRSKAK
jgi:hypothetical protein